MAELDRGKQSAKWQALNKIAMEHVCVIPTLFELRSVAGDKIKPTYLWAPYGSWAYGEMSVTSRKRRNVFSSPGEPPDRSPVTSPLTLPIVDGGAAWPVTSFAESWACWCSYSS